MLRIGGGKEDRGRCRRGGGLQARLKSVNQVGGMILKDLKVLIDFLCSGRGVGE